MEIFMFSSLQDLLQYGILGYDYTSLPLFIVGVALTFIIPYLLGSINSAILVSKIFFREDVRNSGSGNAGTTNVMRCYGKKAALLTLLGDILKTVIAVLVGGMIMGLGYVGYGFAVGLGGYIAAFSCVVGHVWPIYHGFRGGKGVLCLATVVGMLSPIVLLILLLCFVGLVAFTRYISLGSVIGALLYPFLLNRISALFFSQGIVGMPTLIAMVLALLIVFCHRGNLKRLLNGEENKFSFHSSKKPDAAQEEQH